MKHCDEDSVLMAKVDSTLVELGLVMSEDDRREFGGANTHTSTVVSVETSWKSTRALRFMAANSLHAVAVVDGKGRLVATLSLSDLRRLPVAELFDEDPTVERLLAQAHRVARNRRRAAARHGAARRHAARRHEEGAGGEGAPVLGCGRGRGAGGCRDVDQHFAGNELGKVDGRGLNGKFRCVVGSKEWQ
ncbi:hypothetical protein DFJ73DRAFT_429793 [Zopfochytrium polystomum]|nr:hypothetical protein DFJ73DRAFT_429793 [Zopfochytrium polystomum]